MKRPYQYYPTYGDSDYVGTAGVPLGVVFEMTQSHGAMIYDPDTHRAIVPSTSHVPTVWMFFVTKYPTPIRVASTQSTLN